MNGKSLKPMLTGIAILLFAKMEPFQRGIISTPSFTAQTFYAFLALFGLALVVFGAFRHE